MNAQKVYYELRFEGAREDWLGSGGYKVCARVLVGIGFEWDGVSCSMLSVMADFG